jgi:hypothetical protein
MAVTTSTVTLTVNPYPRGIDNTQRTQIFRGTVAFSPGVYPSGGYAVSWAALQQTGSGIGVMSIPAGSSTPTSTSTPFPIDVDINSHAYNTTTSASGASSFGPSGFIYVWDNVNGNIHIFRTNTGSASGVSGPLFEWVPGTDVSSQVVNDVITFTAVFARG